MNKLYIHETDCHGQGNVIYKDKVRYYCYDGEKIGDWQLEKIGEEE